MTKPEGVSFIDSEERWPLPFVSLNTPTGDRSMFIQGDRFGVLWEFDEEGSEGSIKYPGFEVLSREVRSKLDEFTGVLAEHSGPDLQTRGSRVLR